ncbi:MAG TPA: asparagine--tRNA ligase [Firmicutes bacterium]|nr:asparagine--tRNA ligase [Bacillota bacterium]
MPWVRLEELGQHVGEEVEVRGWLYNRRSSGKIHFLIVRDGSGFAQAVATAKALSAEVFAACERIPQESSLRVRGVVRQDSRAPGGYELDLTGLEVVQEAAPYPISLKEHGVDFLLKHRHLWLRTQRQQAIMRIRHTVIDAIREHLNDQGFLCVDAPILTPSACEGTTTLFRTEYFDDHAYLSQSGQLYNEATCAALGLVYCFGPTFRAEKSKTRRHLTEFWMVEPEMAYWDLERSMALGESLVVHIIERVREERRRELEVLERDLSALEKVVPPFPRISYDQARQLLAGHGRELPWGEDFGAPDETLISKSFERPVYVHRYPAACKAFYMKRDPARPEVALCADLLAPEGYGEIIGGGQREDDLATLEARVQELGLPAEAYSWYLDLRRYGSVPHSGFGLGVERTVGWVCGLEHVRETIPFPRMLYHLSP